MASHGIDAKMIVALLAQAALFLVILSFALQAQARDVAAALRNWKFVLKGVVAVNIVVPAVALVAGGLMHLDRPVWIGITIMAVSPLAPLAPGKMLKGGLDVSSTVGLYVALILIAVPVVPATVALIGALYSSTASAPVAAVAALVLKTILVPVAIGLAIAQWAPSLARSAARVSSITGMIGVAILVALVLFMQGRATFSLVGDGTLFVIVATVSAGLVAGHLLGGGNLADSNALAMAAAIRHPGIAALIANANFTDRRVMLAVILFLLTSFVMASAYQWWLKRLLPKPTAKPAPAGIRP